MYLQLFWPFKWARFCVYLGATTTALFYTTVEIYWLYYMTPRKGETFLSVGASSAESKVLVLTIPVAAVGLGIDMYLLVLPITAVLQLQLPTRRKIEVVLVFLTGLAYGPFIHSRPLFHLRFVLELACRQRFVSTIELCSSKMAISPGIFCQSTLRRTFSVPMPNE